MMVWQYMYLLCDDGYISNAAGATVSVQGAQAGTYGGGSQCMCTDCHYGHISTAGAYCSVPYVSGRGV